MRTRTLDTEAIAQRGPAWLTIGIASSALFDLTESDSIFREQGEAAYAAFQRAHADETLLPGVAFPFIRRLLSLNEIAQADQTLVDVIVLSRNSPDTGLRVLNSAAFHGLDVRGAIFTEGQSPYVYMSSLNMSLFLSADARDVKGAVALGFPAGQVLPSTAVDDPHDHELRIAFDFDGVLADDSADSAFLDGGLDAFNSSEANQQRIPLPPGPLNRLLEAINRLQRLEDDLLAADADYQRRIRVSIVTARGVPSHARPVHSLEAWGLKVDNAFFMAGLPKHPVLAELRPHIFFEDHMDTAASAASSVPSVHIPFGYRNQ